MKKCVHALSHLNVPSQFLRDRHPDLRGAAEPVTVTVLVSLAPEAVVVIILTAPEGSVTTMKPTAADVFDRTPPTILFVVSA